MMHAMQVVLAKAVACWYDVSMQTISLHTRMYMQLQLFFWQLPHVHMYKTRALQTCMPNSSKLLIVYCQSNHL